MAATTGTGEKANQTACLDAVCTRFKYLVKEANQLVCLKKYCLLMVVSHHKSCSPDTC